jgi:hypothetical protein
MSNQPPKPDNTPLAVILAIAEAITGAHREPRRRVFIVITENGPILLP